MWSSSPWRLTTGRRRWRAARPWCLRCGQTCITRSRPPAESRARRAVAIVRRTMRHPLIMGTWTTCTPGRSRRIASSVSNARADRAGLTTSRSCSCPAAICVCAKSARRASTPAHFATASRTPASKSTCLDLQLPSLLRSGPMGRSDCCPARIWTRPCSTHHLKNAIARVYMSWPSTSSSLLRSGPLRSDPIRSEVVIVKCQDLQLLSRQPCTFLYDHFPALRVHVSLIHRRIGSCILVTMAGLSVPSNLHVQFSTGNITSLSICNALSPYYPWSGILQIIRGDTYIHVTSLSSPIRDGHAWMSGPSLVSPSSLSSVLHIVLWQCSLALSMYMLH